MQDAIFMVRRSALEYSTDKKGEHWERMRTVSLRTDASSIFQAHCASHYSLRRSVWDPRGQEEGWLKDLTVSSWNTNTLIAHCHPVKHTSGCFAETLWHIFFVQYVFSPTGRICLGRGVCCGCREQTLPAAMVLSDFCAWADWGPCGRSTWGRWGRSKHPLRRAASQTVDRCAHSLQEEQEAVSKESEHLPRLLPQLWLLCLHTP